MKISNRQLRRIISETITKRPQLDAALEALYAAKSEWQETLEDEYEADEVTTALEIIEDWIRTRF